MCTLGNVLSAGAGGGKGVGASFLDFKLWEGREQRYA